MLRNASRAALFGLGSGIVALVVVAASVVQADITRFYGSFAGSAKVLSVDGSKRDRDMSVGISGVEDGFRVTWTSTTYRENGTGKEKSYTIDFVPSSRPGVYSSAMKRNVFGHDVQLDPMKGEPYVWGRIEGDTLSVYSMYVTDVGGYEIQQFDRTLASGGLTLDFKNVRNGEILRTVTTFLKRE